MRNACTRPARGHRALSLLLAMTVLAATLFTGSLPGSSVTAQAASGPSITSIESSTTYGYVTLTWNVASYAKKYTVYRKEAGGSWKALKTVSSATTSTTVSGAKDGKETWYKIRAVISEKTGLFGVNLYADGATKRHIYVKTVTTYGVTNYASGTIGVQRGTIDEDYDLVEIQYSTSSSFSGAKTAYSKNGGCPYPDTQLFTKLSLTKGKYYYVRVRYSRYGYYSGWSQTYKVKITK